MVSPSKILPQHYLLVHPSSFFKNQFSELKERTEKVSHSPIPKNCTFLIPTEFYVELCRTIPESARGGRISIVWIFFKRWCIEKMYSNISIWESGAIQSSHSWVILNWVKIFKCIWLENNQMDFFQMLACCRNILKDKNLRSWCK